MTTDTVPKAASRQLQIGGRTVTVTGISKGAGMIRPNMATMLGFVATDAAIAPALLQQLVREAADESFNRITIDGDTSTNDSFVLIATAARRQRADRPISTAPTAAALREAVFDGLAAARAGDRARRRGRDQVHHRARRRRRAASTSAARSPTRSRHSPLVKTAFFASDPNLGRILAAVGYAGIDDLDQTRIDLFLDDVHVVEGGGRAPGLPRGRRPARDEAERDHGARRPAPRRRTRRRSGPAT